MSDNNPIVLMETSKGEITIELDREKAPISVKNFIAYANSGFYENTIFHRVLPDFMIQGGGLLFNLKEKTVGKPIQNEANNGLKNLRGTVAMARTSDIHSSTAQFFINVVDNDFLDYRGDSPEEYGYAVFGNVIDGMDVVDAIAAEPTAQKGAHEAVPRRAITIKGVIVDE